MIPRSPLRLGLLLASALALGCSSSEPAAPAPATTDEPIDGGSTDAETAADASGNLDAGCVGASCDECKNGVAGCDPNATCADAPGAPAVCTCNPGFTGDGRTCTAAPTCEDKDKDGVCAAQDCDDSAATGSSCSKSCLTYYRDADGDGFGLLAVSVTACTAPSGFVAVAGDCADQAAADPACGGLGGAKCRPGLPDLCNGFDDDCSTVTADGSAEPTVGTACDGTDADSCLNDALKCVAGAMQCVNHVGGPTAEVCGDKVDNDCDGNIDCADSDCNGATCNDGKDCTKNDVCSGGLCNGTTYSCGDALTCTTDTCDGNGGCSHPQTLGTCLVANACFSPGDLNPANPCQHCNPATATTTWTTRDDDTPCGAGLACAKGACVDVDECATNNGGCSSYLTCVNHRSSPATCADLNELSEPIQLANAEGQFVFAYAPSIIHTAGAYHAYFCSGGTNTVDDWDRVRHVSSTDLRNWSAPSLASMAVPYERSNCDPSIVRANLGDGDFYYLFYSGNVVNVQTVNFVARSATPDGPFLKLTVRDTWEATPTDPRVITAPAKAYPDGASWKDGVVSVLASPLPGWAPIYGAGQPSVVMRGNTFVMFYTDTTAELPAVYRSRIFMTTSTDLRTWTAPVGTSVYDRASVDVKFDDASSRYVMVAQDAPHQKNVQVELFTSADGISWSAPRVICDADCHQDWSNNIGMSGDDKGHIETHQRMMIAYAAPYRLDPSYNNDCAVSTLCFPQWSLFGHVIATGLSGTEQPYAMTTATSTNVFPGFLPAYAVDGNAASIYSSNVFPTAGNPGNAVSLAAYMASAQSVGKVVLKARMSNGKPVAFPVEYDLALTTPTNSAWVPIGHFTTQPGKDGVATILLPTPATTLGVLVTPTVVGKDDNGTLIFQLAEVQLAGW